MSREWPSRPQAKQAAGSLLCLRAARQVAVPTSQRHARAEAQLRRLTGNVSVSDITASVLWRATPEFSRALARELYDASAAVCVQPFLAGAVLDTDNEIPMVLDAHNSEVELKSQLLARDEAGLWMLERVREIERFATQRSVLVAATTESDLRDLRALAAGNGAGDNPVAGTGSWVVVPNGVDVGEIKFVTGEERRQLGRSMLARLHAAKLKHLVLFVGSAHPPNITAGRWLASKAHLIPDSLVVLAGEHSDSVDVDRTPNVRALGTVDTDDLKRLLAAASVAVNPTIGGSGSNLKLIEYLAAGAPVVTTPDGARGIEYPHVVASLAPLESFMSTLREVLANPSSRRVTAARELAESRYDWAMTARRFAEQLESALEGDGSGSGVGGQQAGEAP